MKEIDLAIVVICNNSELYDNIILNYWTYFIKYISENNLKNQIQIYLLFGKGSNTEKYKHIQKNIIVVPCRENFNNILKKTILGIEYVNTIYNYKYLIRSNITSFWIIDNLLKLIQILPPSKVYAGPNNWDKFISGCGIIMSRDVSQKLIDNITFTNLPDDVQIAKTINTKLSGFLEYRSKSFNLYKTNIEKISIKYKILYLIDQPIKQNEYEGIHKFIIQNNVFHVRIKSSFNRTKDLGLFQYLSSRTF